VLDPWQRQRIFFCSLCVQISSEAHQATYPMVTGDPFPGGKARMGRAADYSPPYRPEVRDVYELYFLPPYRLHGGSGTALHAISRHCNLRNTALFLHPTYFKISAILIQVESIFKSILLLLYIIDCLCF
jgi:hypothetical protein